MLRITKNVKTAFSLVEILVSLAIFSILIASVVTITIAMVTSQKNVQAKLFLAQTANTTLESMSRQIRYGYNYTGGDTLSAYDGVLRIGESKVTVTQNLIAGGSTATTTDDIYATTTAVTVGSTTAVGYAFASTTSNSSSLTATISSQLLTNVKDSPFIIFETQQGNPNSYSDQNAFCTKDGQLYKISTFSLQASGGTYESTCAMGAPMLPENIKLQDLSFDIYGDNSESPKNPMVRIKMRLEYEDIGTLDVQTTVTQRLVTYF